MKVFISSTYRTQDNRKRIDKVKAILAKLGCEVFTAKDVDWIDYGKKGEVRKEIFEKEKAELLSSDFMVAVLAEPTLGTSMEMQCAADHNIPVVALVLSEDPGLTDNVWLEEQAGVVKNYNELEAKIKSFLH